MRVVVFDLDHTLFSEGDVLHDGVQDLLLILRRLGVRIAGVSSRDHRVITLLEEAGVRPFFAEILCSDGHAQPKEAVGMRHLLTKLNAEPHHTVLVSHAHADILLGKDMGLHKTIGVSHQVDHKSASPLLAAGADHVVGDIPSVLDVLE